MIRNPGLWLGVFSAAFVLTLIVGDMGRTSPGPLATVHERHPDLMGGRGCSDCHGGWTSTMTTSCLDCHTTIDTQMEAGTGLHGLLGAEAETCALCHSEHHGADFAIVNAQSFVNAGFADQESFDHERIGFLMQGAHLELECIDCHAHIDDPVLAEGTQRFGGLSQDCASCHEDPHEERYALDCTSCHSQNAFDEFASDGHEEFLPLLGAHDLLNCADCHDEQGAHSLDFLGTGRRRALVRACGDCHDTPHKPGFLEGIARTTRQDVATSCADCHDPEEHTDFLDERLLDMPPSVHALTGFLLKEPHDDAACSDCHAPPESGPAAGAADFSARYPGRLADDCVACHVDPHAGQFDTHPAPERGCLACHDRLRFEPHTFGVERHGQITMPLTGSHASQECNACHRIPEDHGEGAARVFRGTDSTCESCHADAHLGFFEEFVATAEPSFQGECARCHNTTTFAEQAPGGFDHALWTGFPILGAHAQTGCEACHPRSHEPDETGRRFGRVEEHFGVEDGCVRCHDDPHRGIFDADHLPVEVDGKQDCARCHEQTSFRSFPGGFFHYQWTGFKIIGAHREVDCSACHAPLPVADEVGRTWSAARGSACYDCHADPHLGQFRRDGLTDCASCHASAHGWDDLSFDHDDDSRFPLDSQHEDVSCAACHEPWSLDDGSSVVRYRPLSTECFDCHGVPEEELRELQRNR